MMTTIAPSSAWGASHQLSNETLTAELRRFAAAERHATAHLVAALAEFDLRRLYLAAGCSSLFTYCTQVLHFSEHAAYGRIEAARAARRFPELLTMLADGALTLTAVCLLARHLTAENCSRIVQEAKHKSKRDVEQLVAALRPQPDVSSSVRKLPAGKTVEAGLRDDSTRLAVPPAGTPSEAPRPGPPPAPPIEGGPPNPSAADLAPPRSSAPPVLAFSHQRAIVAPLAPDRYKVQFTVGRETYKRLRRAQDLLRHRVPNGDIAVIFDRALERLLDDLGRRKIAPAAHPRSPSTRPEARRSRHIPAAVRREVWRRDGGQCAFAGHEGRCRERGFLEFHHVLPYARGGETTAQNLQLRCRRHNAYEAEQTFGPCEAIRVRETDRCRS